MRRYAGCHIASRTCCTMSSNLTRAKPSAFAVSATATATVADTLRFKIAHEDITVYNAVQKLLYIVVILMTRNHMPAKCQLRLQAAQSPRRQKELKWNPRMITSSS